MQERTYYDSETGRIITSVRGSLELLDLTAYEQYPYLDGFGDARTQYVADSALVNMPPRPNEDSVFDYDIKDWVNADPAERWLRVRLQREQRLAASDWTQYTDSPLSSEKKALWAAYRQQLRDITTQPDPFNIMWPSTPA